MSDTHLEYLLKKFDREKMRYNFTNSELKQIEFWD